jgi:uncharacterized MAPEG superfamily protein
MSRDGRDIASHIKVTLGGAMSTELMYLVWITALTALMWIPYIFDRISVWGLTDAVGYPQNPKPQSPWARRIKSAHANAIENLVVFATLVLAARAVGISNGTTALACELYFWARLVHFAAYGFALPWVRTLAFAGGFVAQMMLVGQLLLH